MEYPHNKRTLRDYDYDAEPWKRSEITSAYRGELEEMIQSEQQKRRLIIESVEATALLSAYTQGRIDGIEMAIEITRPNREEEG